MKIAVAGKGGVGKTTIAGTLARSLAQGGQEVLALDADTNPMLGVSLGVGPEQTDLLVAVRQALQEGEVEHQPTIEGMEEAFGTDAPDGIRLVVATRIDRFDSGCLCCGVSPDQLLREFETDDRVVICDLEAGVGTLMRLQEGQADLVVVVANPSAKSIDVARRALEIAESKAAVLLVANRVSGPEDVKAIASALGREPDVVVPEDPVIAGADRDGEAAIDAGASAPGVVAIRDLAERLVPAAA
jgi:CO dehydrogenase maturation factor